MADTSTSAEAALEDTEGVVISVASKNVKYPPEELVCDLDMLYDESQWQSLVTNTNLQETSWAGTESDLLFKIKTDSQEELVLRYFSMILAQEEYSQRGLYLCTLAIKNNPSNYTAWYYRTECVGKMTLNIKDELDFARKCTFASPKSYQPWNYRRNLCTKANCYFDELEYIQVEISASPKNHCAWSLLTWVVHQHLHDTKKLMVQLEFCDFLLDADVYNNTAWVYRRFLLEHTRDDLDAVKLKQMGQRDFQRLLDTPNNHSAAEFLCDALPLYFGAAESQSGCYCIQLESCKERPQPCDGPWIECVLNALRSSSEVAALQLVYNLESQQQANNGNRNCSPLQLQRLQELKVADPIRSPYYSELISRSNGNT